MALEQLDEELQLIVARRVPVGRGRRGEHLHAGALEQLDEELQWVVARRVH